MPPKLIDGPYIAPACQVGDWLDDEISGRVLVGGWTDTPIPWPRRKKTGKPSLILCGSLVDAVRVESVEAIRHYWGVGATTVWSWRQALGVDRVTAGTQKLLQERTGVPPEAAAKGRATAATPESRAKMAETKRGQPMPDVTRKALLRATKRNKSPAWGVRANAWMRGVELPEPESMAGTEWLAREDVLLIKHKDRPSEALAAMLGRTPDAVLLRSRRIGVSKNISTSSTGSPKRPWAPEDDLFLRRHFRSKTAKEIGAALNRSTASVRSRARFLGLRR